jgi:hypothetical protein
LPSCVNQTMQLVSNFAPVPETPSLSRNFVPVTETLFSLRHRRDPALVTRSGCRLPMEEKSRELHRRPHPSCSSVSKEPLASLGGEEQRPPPPPSSLVGWWMRVILSPHILSWSFAAGLLHVREGGGATWGMIQAPEKTNMKVQTHSFSRRHAADGEEVRGSLA